MDSKALYSISYGVFILGSHDDKKINACVTNTCMQVAANPARLAITVINQNYTCEQIKACGTFALSVLDKEGILEIKTRGDPVRINAYCTQFLPLEKKGVYLPFELS